MTEHQEVMRYLKEIAARNKRIETRLTNYLNSIGFDSGAQPAVWADGEVHLPRAGASLEDALLVIPVGWLEEVHDVPVLHNGKVLAVLTSPYEDDLENKNDAP